MKKISIGVVLATYNGERYIGQQLDSIINQTLRPDIIIISDANSQDLTLSIARKILSDSKIEHLILTSDSQLSVRENFQKGLEAIDTDFIFFCDQDDVWVSEKIEITISCMQRFKASFAFTNAQLVDSDLCSIRNGNLWNRIKYHVDCEYCNYEKNDSAFINELLKHNVVTGMCMCISNDLKSVVLPFSNHGIHDSWIALNAISTGNVVAINQKLVLYRQHSSNVIGANNANIGKKIEKSKKYISNIENRICLIQDWKVKYNADNACIDEYIKFLMFRLNFIRNHQKYSSIITKFCLYKKFEVRPFSIFLKDNVMRRLNR